MPIFALTCVAMLAFAANSVLARLALINPIIDPASYTLIRIAAGALMLSILVMANKRVMPIHIIKGGNLWSAAALFVYAGTLSFAYIGLDTGIGALILFAMVQATMIGWALIKGDRPVALEWVGMIAAFAAFIWLVSPGLAAPDPLSALLMGLSGVAWGIYSLRGRGAKDPLQATAGNFVLAVPMAALVSLIFVAQLNINTYGFLLAVASGAITSGLGYAIWYRVLPQISATQGAIVQLTVPVIAGLGGLVWAGEPFTLRFILASIFILGGVALAIAAKKKRAAI